MTNPLSTTAQGKLQCVQDTSQCVQGTPARGKNGAEHAKALPNSRTNKSPCFENKNEVAGPRLNHVGFATADPAARKFRNGKGVGLHCRPF
eukprot:CAMPEP_0198590538 /NCGR_PEP_ID=MMETSP1462-20131121/135793_1 /TAXON_ID=1333877 /ORGANISM="Brandtodinium nutriculum, Strain RCC3387" /LENGTH=90 /DNA_ID=CAMNT_0044322071 /DNA_START=329 /DNA_END=598 /DNA_ORIENTATION=-